MDYLQTLFSMFNAPLFATFIIGMFWKRATPQAGWTGLVGGTLGALGVNILIWTGNLVMPGQGGAFLAAGVAFTVDVIITILVSMVTKLIEIWILLLLTPSLMYGVNLPSKTVIIRDHTRWTTAVSSGPRAGAS